MSITKRVQTVSNWLQDPVNAGPISGVAFSGLHAIIFSHSPSPTVQSLGYASLALTASISALRILQPNLNKKLSSIFNQPLEKISMPQFDSAGFPLFINGIVLTGIALTAFANGDGLSGSISLAYAIANTDKGARISQNTNWTMEHIGSKIFNAVAKILPNSNTKAGLTILSEEPPRFLKHSLYLPELWGSIGAGIYGFSHSGMAAAVGALSASVAVTAAAINNGDLTKSAISKVPVLNRITKVSDFGSKTPASDQVLSRRFMKYSSLAYSAGALFLGNFLPALAHGMGATGNLVLERADKSRQMMSLNKD